MILSTASPKTTTHIGVKHLTVDFASHIYTAETTNRLIRSVSLSGTMAVVVSTNTTIPWLNTTILSPSGVAVAKTTGNSTRVFFACAGNQKVGILDLTNGTTRRLGANTNFKGADCQYIVRETVRYPPGPHEKMANASAAAPQPLWCGCWGGGVCFVDGL